jgi:hypothetical protein
MIRNAHKHTPVNWVAIQPDDAGGWWIVTDEAGKELGSGDGGLSEEDARLIAAAPEILEALTRTLSYLTSYPGNGAMSAYDQARAAIAKATGDGK